MEESAATAGAAATAAAAEEVRTLSVKELKALIARAGLGTQGCVEKADLIARAVEAHELLGQQQQEEQQEQRVPKQEDASSSGSARTCTTKAEKLGAYECLLVGHHDVEKLDVVVIVLHGFSAQNTDFVPLANEMARRMPSRRFMFVLPQAPVSAASMGAAAWWEIDVMRWLGAMQMGEAGVAKLIRDKPNGLEECRTSMKEMVKAIEGRFLGDDVPLLIGGFSQGAMTAADLSWQLVGERRVHGVMMFSGAPIVVDEWHDKLTKAGKDHGLRVLMTHGRADNVLPFQASGWARDLLANSGVNVRYETHNGGHELGGPHILQAIQEFMEETMARS
ncbi:Acyl-protein thioesterase 1 [Hondaea fermentalgiana]|uniref:Acyl-protein thioesterase 1 n=1 Tax=Hondaea fermentalgiana TaxID=2315210 RepID=A0A2R5GT80_9STRA|nr:Acyl-protein thioesterase 1 [Hondaea fermentalgiana]|eukprot:GBG32968.1 Acyl-protein thioesterase 1 [Hondaea fermentalgiana]